MEMTKSEYSRSILEWATRSRESGEKGSEKGDEREEGWKKLSDHLS